VTEQLTVVVGDHGGSLASLVDEARSRLEDLEVRGYRPTRFAVPRADYDSVVAVRAAELRRGIPLLLLGLDVVPVDDPYELTASGAVA
jgi:hypothetical protein